MEAYIDFTSYFRGSNYFFGFSELYSALNIIPIFQGTLLAQSNERTVSIYV